MHQRDKTEAQKLAIERLKQELAEANMKLACTGIVAFDHLMELRNPSGMPVYPESFKVLRKELGDCLTEWNAHYNSMNERDFHE